MIKPTDDNAIVHAASKPGEESRWETERATEANRERVSRNDGSCSVCEAPLGIWCDRVVHALRNLGAEHEPPAGWQERVLTADTNARAERDS